MIRKSNLEVKLLRRKSLLGLILCFALCPINLVNAEETSEESSSESTIKSDLVKETDDYAQLLENYGSQFEQKKDYLEDSKYKDKLEMTLKLSHEKKHQTEQKNSQEVSNKRIEKIQKELDQQKDSELTYYVVQEGDTVEYLSQAFNMDVREIAEVNQLESFEELKDNQSFLKKAQQKLLLSETNKIYSPKTKYQSDYPLFVGDILTGIIIQNSETIETSEIIDFDQLKLDTIQYIKNNKYNISQDVINKYIDYIQNAQTQDEVNKWMNEMRKYQINPEQSADESSQQTTSNENNINQIKNKAINQLLSMNISQEQYNLLVAEIDNCKNSSELDKVMAWAKSLAAENTNDKQDNLTNLKENAKQTVANLGLNQDQLNEVYYMIDAAHSEGEINYAVSYANSLRP